jgi:eukaryotic-like serine/threonine-protein kinase
VRQLSDHAIAHLRELMDLPDIESARYEIVRRIGEGGMGVVYLARDRELDREVALKVLSAPEPTEGDRARLLREARILGRLEHPGIVPVHDVGALADGRVFYVMKHVRGERLDAYAGGDRLRSELLRVVRQLCEAVAFSHACGVLHRDLKPQNVMLGAFGEVLVLDWGVAKLRGDVMPAAAAVPHVQDADTATGAVLGTPGYMAPEQLTGHGTALDERVDVYGLGGILYFLLVGEHPRPSREVSSRWGSVPAPLRAIADKARAADPAARYRTALELSADIGSYLDGLPVAAHREGLAERVWRVAVRHRTPILLVLAYLIMRGALIVLTGR